MSVREQAEKLLKSDHALEWIERRLEQEIRLEAARKNDSLKQRLVALGYHVGPLGEGVHVCPPRRLMDSGGGSREGVVSEAALELAKRFRGHADDIENLVFG